MAATPAHVSVMVVRLWTESPASGLRARLTYSLDLNRPGAISEAAGTQDEVIRIVQEWIDTFVEQTH